jgi:hypothetical protein
MSGQGVLIVGYGLATVLYGGYFVRMILKRRQLRAALVTIKTTNR